MGAPLRAAALIILGAFCVEVFFALAAGAAIFEADFEGAAIAGALAMIFVGFDLMAMADLVLPFATGFTIEIALAFLAGAFVIDFLAGAAAFLAGEDLDLAGIDVTP